MSSMVITGPPLLSLTVLPTIASSACIQCLPFSPAPISLSSPGIITFNAPEGTDKNFVMTPNNVLPCPPTFTPLRCYSRHSPLHENWCRRDDSNVQRTECDWVYSPAGFTVSPASALLVGTAGFEPAHSSAPNREPSRLATPRIVISLLTRSGWPGG
jgi:hypothetical protein